MASRSVFGMRDPPAGDTITFRLPFEEADDSRARP
jgi:hypothetical protein